VASHYYYLAAQLPYLIYGQNIPMSSDAFRSLALEFMSTADAAVLDSCTLDPDSPSVSADPDMGDEIAANPGAGGLGATYARPAKKTSSSLVNNWKKWERTLRLNLAKGRSLKFKRDGASLAEAPEDPPDAASAAKTALLMDSPLEAELYLDKARWDVIESFQGVNNFHKNAIYAYLLKLLLMERRAAFNAEEGFSEYKRLYAAILGEKNDRD